VGVDAVTLGDRRNFALTDNAIIVHGENERYIYSTIPKIPPPTPRHCLACRILGMLIPSMRNAAILRRTMPPSLRQYHSANHPPSPIYTPLQHQILSKALALVPSKGFTPETLTEGAKHAGYLEITHNLFPRGPWSLVEYHLVRQREALSSVPLEEGLGVGRTIRKLCVERLKGNTEIIGQWQDVPRRIVGYS